MADDGSTTTKAITDKSSVEQAFSSIKEHYDIEMPKVKNLSSVKNIYTIAAILNNIHILQKTTSQSTQNPGEEDPQSLGVLRV